MIDPQDPVVIHVPAKIDAWELRRVVFGRVFRSYFGLLGVLLVFSGLYAAIRLGVETRSIFAALIVVLVWFCFLVYAYGKSLGVLDNRLERRADKSHAGTFEFAQTGITWTNLGGAREFQWQSITSAEEVREGFLLTVRRGMIYVSRSWFADNADQARFVRFLQLHLGSRARLTSGYWSFDLRR